MKPIRCLRPAGALLALVLAAARGATAPDAPAADAPLAFTAGPLLQAPTDSGVTVTWITNRPTTAVVEYGPVGGELQTAFTSHDGLIDGNERLHRVALSGLRPDTPYRYRVVSREITNFRHWKIEYGATVTSDFREFRVAGRGQRPFAFLLLNDLHDQPGTIPDLLRVAGPRPYGLVVLNGDIVSYLDSETQVAAMFQQATTSFAATVPLVWVRGNHETRGKFARQLPAYLGAPGSRYFGAFDQGPVHFVVLDTGEDKIDGHREYSGMVDFSRYRREEGEWLRHEVQSEAFRRAKYRVVLCHMPFPSARAADPERHAEKGVFLGMADAFEQFGVTLEAAGIDLMFCGHTHTAAVIAPEPGRHSYPVLQGGGPKGDGRTVIRAEADDEALTATILGATGATLGTCRVPARR